MLLGNDLFADVADIVYARGNSWADTHANAYTLPHGNIHPIAYANACTDTDTGLPGYSELRPRGPGNSLCDFAGARRGKAFLFCVD